MFSLRSLPAAAAAVLALAGATAAQAAPTVLSTEKAPTTVAAYDGVVMWSSLDQATGDYKLMQSINGGAPTAVAVPERDKPFDVDLGTNHGSTSTMAVYSRDGFIYRLNVGTGVEEKLTNISLGGDSFNPSIERGRIAFIHSGRGHDELRLAGALSGSGKPKLLVRGVIDNVELGLTQVAYTVFKDAKFGGSQTVHIRNTGTGHDKSVYTAKSGGANDANITKPSFTDDTKAFVWARTNLGSGVGNRVIKYTLHTGKLSYAAGSLRYASTAWVSNDQGLAFSTALDPGSNAGCDDAGVAFCQVGTTGPLTFNLKP